MREGFSLSLSLSLSLCLWNEEKIGNKEAYIKGGLEELYSDKFEPKKGLHLELCSWEAKHISLSLSLFNFLLFLFLT